VLVYTSSDERINVEIQLINQHDMTCQTERFIIGINDIPLH
jgi:hypothetical protein